MRRLLGPLLLVTLLLAGCGDSSDDGSEADDSSPSSPSSGSSESTGPTEPSESSDPDGSDGSEGPGGPAESWQLVEIVHATAVGGEVSSTPTPVGDPKAVASFSAQFDGPGLEEEIQRVVDAHEPPPGFELAATVVAISCDVPTAVTYEDGKVRAMKVKNPHLECFAPVTSVAVLAMES